MKNLPFPIFHGVCPSKYALSAVGACRIYPHLIAPELYEEILQNCLDQESIGNDSKEAKTLRKNGVSMISKLLTEISGLDPSIIDVEVYLLPCNTDYSNLAAMFLDAGATRIVLCGLAVDVMRNSRIPKDRLVAHFDRPFCSSFSASDDFEVSFDSAKKALATAVQFADIVSVNFLDPNNSSRPTVSIQDIIDLVQMLTAIRTTVQLVVQISPVSSAAGAFLTTEDSAEEEQQQPQKQDSFKGGDLLQLDDPYEVEKRAITDLTNTITNIMTSSAADHVRIALENPSPKELGMAYAACIKTDREDGLFTTVVVNRNNEALGLVYSSKASLAASLECGRGVYYSRSRRGLWRKGDLSGHYQVLHRIDLDCDGDALRFMVTQKGGAITSNGGGHFCHLNTLTCWGGPCGLRHLEETLTQRLVEIEDAADGTTATTGSYTARLFKDEILLRNKLVEEAQELSEARTTKHVAEELADVLYFAMVKAVKAGVSFDDAVCELDRRTKKVTRRPGDAKAERIAEGDFILSKLASKKKVPEV